MTPRESNNCEVTCERRRIQLLVREPQVVGIFRNLASKFLDVDRKGLQDPVSPLSRLDPGRVERRLHGRQIVNVHTHGDVFLPSALR